jgi:hypothetical protein
MERMERIDLAELLCARFEWDTAVDATDGVDRWSSGSDWAFSTHATWGVGPEIVMRCDAGFAAFGRLTMDGAEALVGLDPVWAFASPIVGPNPRDLTRAVCDRLEEEGDWDLVFLTGLVAESPLDQACIEAFGRRHQLFAGPASARLVADVSDVERWWSSRGEKFRRNIRRAQRSAEAAGLCIEVVDGYEPDDLMTRLVGLEALSWKGREESGLLGGQMAEFYRTMMDPLQSSSRLRAAVAVRDGRDVGFILGAVRGGTYRGLQVSFAAGHEELSIGNLLQNHELRRVAREGVVRYDLGMDMPYKHHWASASEETRTIVVRR